MSDNGLITIASAYSVKDTIDRVENDIKLKGLTVFARVDHAAGQWKSACRQVGDDVGLISEQKVTEHLSR